MEAMTYAGVIYYQEKGVEDLVTFAAARNLNALIEFIISDFPRAEKGQHVYFRFKDINGCIELKFDAPQDEPFTGWDIKPHMKPCRLHRCDVNRFGEANYPLPPSCLISVLGSPDAVPTLHYSIPLEGVADPVSLYIHRSLRRNPPPPPLTDPTTSSSLIQLLKLKLLHHPLEELVHQQLLMLRELRESLMMFLYLVMLHSILLYHLSQILPVSYFQLSHY
ncbi:PREDICTED: uncharacterized protein LOC109592409 [Amphimedon queenslandica]|uniref:Uncharacterized protein n=2 Tax=Amphimedon queenslandica TaxID=400682 RepID=A0AAN0K2P3_AMPQE|nr:PREDICTED: uncharacterized protein LOC109592409 [Amphimedon queenslandica]|eukprot:XP_019863414.1 PREDICTED: uncharacterized protein LOC109592409 [Amphimedon queenslandica]